MEETIVTTVLDSTAQESTNNVDEIETEEEPLQWLRDELTGIKTATEQLAASMRQTLEAQQQAQITAMEESRNLIRTLTELATENGRNLTTLATAIAVSGMSRSTPNNSQSESQPVTTSETVTEAVIEPASAEQTQDKSGERAAERKRKRL